MREVGVVIAGDGTVLSWHLPPGGSAAALPDSPALWEVLWENRSRLLGFAHSHPGAGRPSPSSTDLATFAAMEAGSGREGGQWKVVDRSVPC